VETRLHCRPSYHTSVRKWFKYHKEVRMNRRTLIAVLLVLATSASIAEEPPGRWHWPWRWFWHIGQDGDRVYEPPADQEVTDNSGAKSVLFRSYDNGKIWTTTGFTECDDNNLMTGFEYDDFRHSVGQVIIADEGDVEAGGVCMASTDGSKFAAWGRNEPPDDGEVVVASQDLDTHADYWSTHVLTSSGHYSYRQQVAIDAKTNFGTNYVCVAYLDSSDSQNPNFEWDVALFVAVSTNNGSTWNQQRLRYWPMKTDDQFDVQNPVVAIDQYSQSGYAILGVIADGCINYWSSTDNGQTWTSHSDVYEGDAVDFSATLWCNYVFLAWSEDDELYYVYSEDLGDTWIWDDDDPWMIPDLPEGVYAAPNVEFLDESELRVIVTHEYYDDENDISYVAEVHGRYSYGEDPTWEWFRWHGLQSLSDEQDDSWNPSLRLIHPTVNTPTHGCCHWSSGLFDPRRSWKAFGEWRIDYSVVPPPGEPVCSGRNLLMDPEGLCQYAGQEPPYVMSGIVSGKGPRPVIVNPGENPALALDGDGRRWVAYLCDDTVFCMLGDGSCKTVFGGLTSAVPGQPSIVCYPIKINGAYVGNIVFPVYDTAGGATKIMYARVDTGGVVLDTIESVANLGDSLPCINVYKSDTLLVTWQRDGSVVASMLCDYGPGTAGQPPAWSSPSVVSASGYHPMSRFDDNGAVLNVVWTGKNGSTYAISRATCDLASTTFGSWSQSATPGDTGTAVKDQGVYAGLGVSCWQELDANGKWIIKGFVRGEETTLVANDTDAYHPHAVAESSAVSPSIDQVRVHLLYTAGVTFELDSGVVDTGDIRYVCESLNVSHATSDATKLNNGAKLVRKTGSDSLFSVYSDQDNAVVFARSANGDTWQREMVAMSRDYPAVAVDSTGQHWIVAHKAGSGNQNSVQELYYFNGGMWSAETLYSASGSDTLGPASLAGASSTTTGIVYAAFRRTTTVLGNLVYRIVLTKFNGTTVAACTLNTAYAPAEHLGDPVVAVEPYKADSDRVYVAWEREGIIYYSSCVDGRGSGIANNWTSNVGLSDMMATSHHPCINADRDRAVVAWKQGSPGDIYARQRLSGTWQTASNISNTANDASDYPTIAMGDTVVVAWQETRSGGADFDILACIDFGDTLNIADNSTFSSYPHVVFQNRASGDTLIPYVLTVWSEEPSASYYEVGFNKLNLKQASGEGQQSASSTPIPAKPTLTACRPNPFHSHTQINYALPKAGNVSLRVYDVTGRTVRTLASGHQKAGNYSVSWDARDSHGRQVPYGVYFYRLDTPGFRSVKKAVVAR
jgi:hypothetical protein